MAMMQPRVMQLKPTAPKTKDQKKTQRKKKKKKTQSINAPGEPVFPCSAPGCDRTFAKASNAKRHFRDEHRDRQRVRDAHMYATARQSTRAKEQALSQKSAAARHEESDALCCTLRATGAPSTNTRNQCVGGHRSDGVRHRPSSVVGSRKLFFQKLCVYVNAFACCAFAR